jgi:histidyl-tRNA synthetase
MILPSFEVSSLYTRSVGETSDIVRKEMFTLTTEKETLALRPEGTASIARSYIQNKLYASPNETKRLFYKGSMFRKERPQAGRQREFTQLGAEMLGIDNPFADAEMISMIDVFFKKLNVTNISLQINSIGCKTCRTAFKQDLVSFLTTCPDLCEDCITRKERNPLRVFDCKNSTCQTQIEQAPILSDYLCSTCKEDYESLKTGLDNLSLSYEENPRLVRGLDYYTKTVFEFIESSIGAQSTVSGGGRYNGLIEEMNGPETPGIGFAIGLERLLIILENQNVINNDIPTLDYFLVWTNEESKLKQMNVAQKLREKGYRVEMDFQSKKMKTQLKVANRKRALFALIMGEDEAKDDLISVKNFATGEQETKSINTFLKETLI